MNLSKYRNRHINYTSNDFIRFDFKTDQSDLLSNLELKEVNIYNPNQSQIDSLPSLLKGKTKAINIWGGNYKNCYAFEELKSIQFISLHNNSKLQFLWAVEKNNKLKGVGLIGCNKIDSIQFLNQNPSITEFHLAGDIWKKQIIRTINPLNKLQDLKFLSLTQLRIEDKNHKALFELSNLKELIISENIFTTEQFAELSVKLESTECKCFKGYTELKENYDNSEDCRDNRIQIVGIRKPELNPQTDKKRIEKYISKFNELKEEYKTGT